MRRTELLPRLDKVILDDTTSLGNATSAAQKGDKSASANVQLYTDRVQAVQAARNVLGSEPPASVPKSAKTAHPANNPAAITKLVAAKTKQAASSSALQAGASDAIGVLLLSGQYEAAQAVGLLIEKQFGADPLAFYTDKAAADDSKTDVAPAKA